jgi:CRP-like cAMP-binding protein
VATIGPGDYFGEMAMLTKQPRGATVTAETALRCLTIR